MQAIRGRRSALQHQQPERNVVCGRVRPIRCMCMGNPEIFPSPSEHLGRRFPKPLKGPFAKNMSTAFQPRAVFKKVRKLQSPSSYLNRDAVFGDILHCKPFVSGYAAVWFRLHGTSPQAEEASCPAKIRSLSRRIHRGIWSCTVPAYRRAGKAARYPVANRGRKLPSGATAARRFIISVVLLIGF